MRTSRSSYRSPSSGAKPARRHDRGGGNPCRQRAVERGSRDHHCQFGVNWADPRGNFADDPVLSGLSTADSCATTKAKAIVSGFRNNDAANTVLMPINPYPVGNAWWSSHTGAIDAATGKDPRRS